MAQVFEDNDVLAHIPSGLREPVVYCYDKRNENFQIVVLIDLFLFLPLSYGDELDDQVLPDWHFVAAAMASCYEHQNELWEAYENLRNDLL